MPRTSLRQLLFICLFIPFSALGQEKYLALDKPGRVKRIRFYAGDEIVLKLNGDKRLYDEVIGGVTDSTLILMGTAIPIRNVRAIIIRRKRGLAQQLVHTLPIAGVIYILAATFNPVFQGEPVRFSPGGFIVGGTLIGGAQFFRLFLKRTYRINGFRRLQVLETY